MSKLQELINELCPDGVEYRKVGELCEVLTGGEAPKDSIKSKEPINDYIYPIYSNGVDNNALWGFSKEHRVDREAITFSSIGTIGYPTFRKACFTPIIRLKVIYPKDENKLSLLFLKYVLEIADFMMQQSSVPNINTSMIKNIKIPVPPLPVQEEIVRILDKMTDYVTELKAELKARKIQYENYRDDLLAFGNSASKGKLQGLIKELCPDGVAHKPLKDVTILNGLKQVSAEKLFSLNTFSGEIKLLPSSNNYDWYCEETKELNEYLYEDEVITLGRARNANIKYHNGKFIASQNHIVRSKNKRELNTKYLYYFLSSSAQSFYTTQSNYPLFNKNDFNNCKIPVPPLPVQEEIVRILDKFNSICNDISTGLPAEIEARQKQYEYYRDKLLSFQKLENEEC